jgi:hypothetical protein
MMGDLIFGAVSFLESDLLGKIFGAVTALALAYNSYLTYRLKKLTLANKQVSEGNAEAIERVSVLGKANADAIEHTRVQNIEIASAVEDTKVQNDGIAEQVGHVHICVETRVAELKDAVKEVVPAVIKEVVPEVIKETLPEVVATLKE